MRFCVMNSVNSTSSSNMMKFAFALVAVLALSSPLEAYNIPRTGTGALADEFQDFADMIPIEEIVNVVMRYVLTDKEVQAVVKYVHSSEFKQLVSDIEAMVEIKNIMNYIQKAGLDVYYLVNQLNKYLDLPQLTPPSYAKVARAASGIRGMLDEVEALIPMEKVKELYRNKLASSKVWADFVAQLTSPEFQNVANKLCANATFKDLLRQAKDAQVDVESLIKLIENTLGLTIPCRP